MQFFPKSQGGALLMIAVVLPTAILGIAAKALAEKPRFSLPVDCVVGDECFVQTYPDQDPSSGYQDYLCGARAYNGHDGTDIRVATLADMRRGIPVVAAGLEPPRANLRGGPPNGGRPGD